jgi:hypothetical protein
VEHLPPANGGEDVFTLLKMYSISPSLVRQHGGAISSRGPLIRLTGVHSGTGAAMQGTAHHTLGSGLCLPYMKHIARLMQNKLHLPSSPGFIVIAMFRTPPQVLPTPCDHGAYCMQMRAMLTGQTEEQVDFPFRSGPTRCTASPACTQWAVPRPAASRSQHMVIVVSHELLCILWAAMQPASTNTMPQCVCLLQAGRGLHTPHCTAQYMLTCCALQGVRG